MKSCIMILAAFAGSFFFAIPSATVDAADKPIPRQVDLRPRFAKFGLTPRNQGSRDTCSLFAVTCLADYELARSASGRTPHLSEEYLVWAANEATGLTGDQAMFIEAVQGLTRFGICTEVAMPYQAQSDGQRAPTDAAREEAGHHGHWSRAVDQTLERQHGNHARRVDGHQSRVGERSSGRDRHAGRKSRACRQQTFWNAPPRQTFATATAS